MKQFLVIGAGRFGSSIAKTLYNTGNEVMVVDERINIINELSDSVTHAIQANATDENIIKSLGPNNFDIVVIAMGADIQSSMLCAIMLKELGAKYIVAKAQNELHAKLLKKIGVNKIIFPKRDMGANLARSLASSSIMDYIELSPKYSMVEISPLEEWIGKNFIEINMRKKYGLNVMAVKHESTINISPKATYTLQKDDILIVIGKNKDLKKL